MKAMIGTAMLLGVLMAPSAPAHAMFAPFEPPKASATFFDNAAMTMEPLGASLEANYFRAPPLPAAARRVFPCRMQVFLFEKTRLAQSCN
jgi:hypothetical protein